MIEKFSEILEKVLGPVTAWMNNNKYVCAIRDAFTIMMPIVIVGSFALLFNIYICSKTGLAKYEALAWLANYSKMFSTVNFACISCMALWLTFLMGYQLGSKSGQNPLLMALIATVSFLVVLIRTIWLEAWEQLPCSYPSLWRFFLICCLQS